MRGRYYRIFLIFVLFICSFAILFENILTISGHATAFTPSNVSIQKSFAISFSDNLSEGIDFGYISFLPAEDVNASHNYDSISNGSSFYVNVSHDGNTDVNFCIRANSGLISSGGDIIGIGNETYTYYNSTNLTHPVTSPKIPLNTSYVLSGEDIPLGGINFWRFWLDVPSGTSTGSYNNTVQIRAIQSSDDC